MELITEIFNVFDNKIDHLILINTVEELIKSDTPRFKLVNFLTKIFNKVKQKDDRLVDFLSKVYENKYLYIKYIHTNDYINCVSFLKNVKEDYVLNNFDKLAVSKIDKKIGRKSIKQRKSTKTPHHQRKIKYNKHTQELKRLRYKEIEKRRNLVPDLVPYIDEIEAFQLKELENYKEQTDDNEMNKVLNLLEKL